jgi:hypothetical protein
MPAGSDAFRSSLRTYMVRQELAPWRIFAAGCRASSGQSLRRLWMNGRVHPKNTLTCHGCQYILMDFYMIFGIFFGISLLRDFGPSIGTASVASDIQGYEPYRVLNHCSHVIQLLLYSQLQPAESTLSQKRPAVVRHNYAVRSIYLSCIRG